MTLVNEQVHEINAIQPYSVIYSSEYKSIMHRCMGISHFYEFTVHDEDRALLAAVPDGCIDLTFSISEDKVQTYISGTVLKAKKWTLGEGTKCFGVRFYPGDCVLPKGLSVDEIIDCDLEIDNKAFCEGLADRIALGGDIKERSKIFLKEYLKSIPKICTDNGNVRLENYVKRRIYESRGNISIKCLSEETGYSECYIRRIFKQIHGISPKVFEKYVRFQNLLHLLKKTSSDLKLNEFAAECGYYDEAHMIKEFKCFAGVTPLNYLEMISGKEELL